jgi:uncharacterized caspase-like protein
MADACFAGFIAGGSELATRGLPRLSLAAKPLVPTPKLIATEDGVSRIIISAGGPDEEAVELSGHGLFTSHVLAGLGGAADLDADSIITASELFSYVTPKVYQDTRGSQTPQMFGWGTGTVPIALLSSK